MYLRIHQPNKSDEEKGAAVGRPLTLLFYRAMSSPSLTTHTSVCTFALGFQPHKRTLAGGPVTAVAREVELPKVNDRQCAYFYDVQVNTRLCAGHNLGAMGICSVSVKTLCFQGTGRVSMIRTG